MRLFEFLELLQDFVRRWPIAEGLAPAGVAEDALTVDDERGRTVAPFGMDAHLKGDSVHGADHVCAVGQQRVTEVGFLQADFFQQVFGGPCFVRIDRQELRTAVFDLFQPVAQLRELPMADWSRVAVNEDQHDRFLPAKMAQPDGSAGQ